jgi:8-oxo-dGTP diphosphatase
MTRVPLILVVAAALFNDEGRVLIAQRPRHKALGGLWEFPGGKVEEDEQPEYALARELLEELEVIVAPDDLKPLAFVSHAYSDFHVLMPLFTARRWNGVPIAREHTALAWARPSELKSYPMPPADAPLIDHLIAHASADACFRRLDSGAPYGSSSTSQ